MQNKKNLSAPSNALSYRVTSFMSGASSDELALSKNVSQKKAGEINAVSHRPPEQPSSYSFPPNLKSGLLPSPSAGSKIWKASVFD